MYSLGFYVRFNRINRKAHSTIIMARIQFYFVYTYILYWFYCDDRRHSNWIFIRTIWFVSCSLLLLLWNQIGIFILKINLIYTGSQMHTQMVYAYTMSSVRFEVHISPSPHTKNIDKNFNVHFTRASERGDRETVVCENWNVKVVFENGSNTTRCSYTRVHTYVQQSSIHTLTLNAQWRHFRTYPFLSENHFNGTR